MPTEPTNINRSRVFLALDTLGIPEHHDVKKVEILPEAVRIVRYRYDGTGQRYAAGNEAATVTTTVAIVDDEEPTR